MGAPPPAPPFVTPEIVSSSERPFTTSPDTIPSASPPRPPSVRSSASPPRPPCIVVTQFEEKLGETNTPAIPAAAPPLPPSRLPIPPPPPVTVSRCLQLACALLNDPSVFPTTTTPSAWRPYAPPPPCPPSP